MAITVQFVKTYSDMMARRKEAANDAQPALDAANAACAAFAPGDTSDAALEAFCAAVNALRAARHSGNGYSFPLDLVGFKRGSKNAKIIVLDQEGNARSAWGFVDLSNGNILKAAGWNAPAKGARGNIVNGAAQVGEHGPAYLR